MGSKEVALGKSTANAVLNVEVDRDEELKKELSKDFTDKDWKDLQGYIIRARDKLKRNEKKYETKIYLLLILGAMGLLAIFFLINTLIGSNFGWTFDTIKHNVRYELVLALVILLIFGPYIAKMRTAQLKKNILGMTKEQRLTYYAELEVAEDKCKKSLTNIGK